MRASPSTAIDLPAPGGPLLPERASGSPRDGTERLSRLLKEQFGTVFRALRRFGVVPNACEDAAQEVFWIASQKLEGVTAARERPFLLGIAVRVAANRRRSQATRREVGDPERDLELATGAAPLPDVLVEKKRLRELLDRVLDALPSELRTVFVLVELEGMSAREVSESLELPAGTVASRLRRARVLFSESAARLRASLDYDGEAKS